MGTLFARAREMTKQLLIVLRATVKDHPVDDETMKELWLHSPMYWTIFTLVAGTFALDKTVHPVQEQGRIRFKDEYVQDVNFAKNFSFKDITDIAVNPVLKHVFVLQRSVPFVTVWSTNDTLLYSWKTTDIGYPHSITLKGTDLSTASVWITDMAGPVTVTDSYGHCIKEFTYKGDYIKSIGSCGKYTNGSSVNPIRFDKVTDIAWSPTSEHYYIADGDLGGLNNRIVVMDSEFHVVDVWNAKNRPGSGPGQFNLPHAIKIDVCNRVWITDAQNYRVQIFSDKGQYLSELKCFGNTLVYGLDFLHTNYSTTKLDSSLLLTTKSVSDNHAEIVCVPVKMDCLNPKDIGVCEIERRFVLSQSVTESKYSPKQSKDETSSMLHSVTVDALSGDIYLSQLPGGTPPLKFYPAPHPPVGNIDQAFCSTDPPQWPMEWNATVLLTPYTDSPLITAQMIYSAPSQAIYVQKSGPHDNRQGTLTVEDRTYTIERDVVGNVKCLGPIDIKKSWITPSPGWLSGRNCKCHGAKVTAGIETVLWRCPNENKFVDWFWFDATTQRLWRMFFNANASKIPVLGDYTMVSFSSLGSDTQLLQKLLKICTNKRNSPLPTFYPNYTLPLLPLNFVTGFSYSGCEGKSKLQYWPEQFYLTVTMLPVNDYNPMPTSVIYDWTQQSQHTIMYAINSTTSAYLIHNNTYIMERSSFNKKVTCLSQQKFGPPRPDWMFLDKCKCMGTISNNKLLSPWPTTAIAVCPLEDGRVFWTWFAISEYYPVIFFETLSPPQEGTSLAYADYHQFYPNNMLVDVQDFVPPHQCMN